MAQESHSGISQRHAREAPQGSRGVQTGDASGKPENAPQLELMLTASEVARLFRVTAKTVGRWGRSGALPLHRTVGGHHRYRLADVHAFLGLDAETPVDA